MNIKDKVIVITGAGGGIGKSLAEALTTAGATVVSLDRGQADVRKEKEVIAFAEKTVNQYGKIDIWINNAGVFHTFSTEDEFVDMEKAHEIMDTNFFGTLIGCRTALKYMKKEKAGVIVNILSSAALDATRATGAKIYAASKWAIRGYLQALKGENKDSGVSIYSVYPGGTKTDLYRDNKPGSYDDYMTPESVAEKIVSNLQSEIPEEELVIKRPSA